MPSPLMLDRSEGSAHGVWVAGAGGGSQAKVAGPDAWTGKALIGTAELDATIGDWFATEEQEYRWTATIHPHHLTGSDTGSEIVAAFDTGTTYFVKVFFQLQAGGVVRVGVDWGDGSTATALWQSLPLDADWRVGVARADWRLTIDPGIAGTYVFTLYKNGVVVYTNTETGMDPFLVPPAATPLVAGTVTGHLVALHSMEMRDGIDGAVLYSMDAETPTGWTPAPTDGVAYNDFTSAPPHPSFLSSFAGRYEVPDPAVFDIGADDSASGYFRFQVPPAATGDAVLYGRDDTAIGTSPMWVLVNTSGFAPHSFIIGDDDTVVIADVGAFVPGTWATVGWTLDRATDDLTTYRDGTLVDTADTSALGAVAPNADVDLSLSGMFTASAGFARRALTPAEHLSLHYELANA